MQDYVEPNDNNCKITSSPSMYVRIKAWLLSGSDSVPPEEIRGDLVNLKVLFGLSLDHSTYICISLINCLCK